MGGSPSRPAPPAVAPPATLYKRIPRWQVDDYNAALERYNRPFKELVGIEQVGAARRAVLYRQNYTTAYNPPMPPWIADGSADNDFIYRIEAYRSQLRKAGDTVREINRAMAANAYMIDALNNPPTPQPPEAIYTTNEPRPAPVTASAAVVGPDGRPVDAQGRPVDAQGRPVDAQGRPLSPEERAYRDLFDEGRGLLAGVGITNYDAVVPYNPPQVGEGRRRVDEKLFELRDLLRKLYAERTGREPANLVFPVSILARENFIGSGRIKEQFTGQTVEYNGKIYRPAALSDNDLWTIRTLNEKRQLCAAKGLVYIPGSSTATTPCFQEVVAAAPAAAPPAPAPVIPQTSQPASTIEVDVGQYNTELAPEPATASLYNYNLTPANLSTYNVPSFSGKDGDSYKTYMAGKGTVKIADIADYYRFLNEYNHHWLRLHGWKISAYNPPRPFWYGEGSTDKEATAYKRTLQVFNDKVRQKKTEFESSEAVSLPAAFGSLPAAPPYPNTLRDLLENPTKYADPARAANLPSVGGSGSAAAAAVEFNIPVQDVSKILTYVAQKPPAPPATKPKCGGESLCVKYKEPPPMVKKFLEEREKQLAEQRKMNDRINSYAMGRPRADGAGQGQGQDQVSSQPVSTNLLQQLRTSILNELGTFTQESMCSE